MQLLNETQKKPIQVVPTAHIGTALMTVGEVSGAIGCSEQTVRNMVHNGELPGVKLGKRLYVNRMEFNALIGGAE